VFSEERGFYLSRAIPLIHGYPFETRRTGICTCVDIALTPLSVSRAVGRVDVEIYRECRKNRDEVVRTATSA